MPTERTHLLKKKKKIKQRPCLLLNLPDETNNDIQNANLKSQIALKNEQQREDNKEKIVLDYIRKSKKTFNL